VTSSEVIRTIIIAVVNSDSLSGYKMDSSQPDSSYDACMAPRRCMEPVTIGIHAMLCCGVGCVWCMRPAVSSAWNNS